MAKQIPLFSQVRSKPLPSGMMAIEYPIVAPWQLERREREIRGIPAGCALLRPLFVGICHADLRYISGSRPAAVLRERLPLVPFHEGCAEVLEVGDDAGGMHPGQKVVVVPNIPCYVQDPARYPSIERACVACRPGGPGENLCTDVAFLASNVDGLARSLLLHPVRALWPLPDDVPEPLGALAEPLSVVHRAIEAANLQPGHRVAVLGAGVMGYLVALMLSRSRGLPAEQILITDIFDERLNSASRFGIGLNTRGGDLPKEYLGEFDRAFECAGGRAAQSTIAQAVQLLKPGGLCVLLGVSEEAIPIPTRLMLDKGLHAVGTTRSMGTDFPPVIELLRRRDFQQDAQRIIRKDAFRGDSVEGILAAAHAAADSNAYGKVLLDWREDFPRSS